MNILLLGSGGREHAFAWKMRQSSLVSNLFVAPGNTGTAKCATNVNMAVSDFAAIKKFCLENGVEMVVVGPEEPLVKGIVDEFEDDELVKHIPVIGPGSTGAQLEGSKAFAKEFMLRHNIPTAAYREFNVENFEEGKEYLRNHSLPVVLKADGLAAGKGVVICQTIEDSIREFEEMILHSKFGAASAKVVVEECLFGIECSVFVLTDGKNYKILPEAKDYKRIGEGDTGLNTGGMGAVSPVPFMNEILKKRIEDEIVRPTVKGLANDLIQYRGFIFIGLMISPQNEPKVIEYNCRMGDPETEVVLPRIKSDLVQLFKAVATQTLANEEIDIDPDTAVGIVAVSGGYPGDFEKGKIITGLNVEEGNNQLVFLAGTTVNNEKIVTNGGRVLVAVSRAKNVKDAVNFSKETLGKLHFDGMYYRSDIGFEFV